MTDDNQLRVQKIENGTVIDHIRAGQALNVLALLGLDTTAPDIHTVSCVMRVASDRLDRKDIVKVEGRELDRDEINVLAVVAPNATINIVDDYEVVEKHRVERPDTLEGVLQCANPNCITTNDNEPTTPRFDVIDTGVRCQYCDTLLTDELGDHLDIR